MSLTRNLCCLLLQTVLVLCQTGDNGNDIDDEKRPYKFGFNIEGYQHRFEEKDTKGIIMGEYGFITGDGVYHLTVYATDENGKFKILKMKNTYIGLPMEKTTTTPPPPSTNGKFSGLAACGGCVVPSSTPSSGGASGIPNSNGGNKPVANAAPSGGAQFNANASPRNPNAAISKTSSFDSPSTPRLVPIAKSKTIDSESTYPNSPLHPAPLGGLGNGRVELGSGQKTSTSGSGVGQNIPGGVQPSLNSAGVPTTDLKNRGINGQTHQGSPNDLTSPLMGLLYKFNYTLTFHGHAETGDRAGNKNGSYFFDGRDGFIRNVTYTANELGYQPNISLIAVDSKEPKEGKENELLWNEFKWFY